MTEYQTWHEYLIERLAADREKMISYLDVALEEYQEDGDTSFFLLGLQNVIEARGGIAEVAKQTGIEAQLLSDILASDEAPRIDIFNIILRGLGCQMSIQPLKSPDSSGEHTVKKAVILPRKSEKVRLEHATESRDLP